MLILTETSVGTRSQKQTRMKRLFFAALTLGAALLLSQQVAAQKRIVINSQPAGAEITINSSPINCQTPAIIKNPGGKSFTIGFKKEGYEDGKQLVVKQRQFTGKKEYPQEINYRMTRSAYAKDTTIPQGAAEEQVSRDNPGDTSLERTVLRWYFESQPQGARIFWRVISSVPDQVKNTNELWLGNTPFEETRSFNIQGLTYENSRDVQIEIKVRRAGYLDQNKRFNVRQAIDQQEISSFFDMIKAEE